MATLTCMCTVALDGGGYQWRIAPAGVELTESAFQKMVLPFEGMSSLRWGGKSGKQLYFNATRVSTGTVPQGSTWTMNPLPRADATLYPDAMDAFPAVCDDPHAPSDGSTANQGLCSGWYGPDNLEVVDNVRVPASLKPGTYVVQWRCKSSRCSAGTAAIARDNASQSSDKVSLHNLLADLFCRGL